MICLLKGSLAAKAFLGLFQKMLFRTDVLEITYPVQGKEAKKIPYPAHVPVIRLFPGKIDQF